MLHFVCSSSLKSFVIMASLVPFITQASLGHGIFCSSSLKSFVIIPPPPPMLRPLTLREQERASMDHATGDPHEFVFPGQR